MPTVDDHHSLPRSQSQAEVGSHVLGHLLLCQLSQDSRGRYEQRNGRFTSYLVAGGRGALLSQFPLAVCRPGAVFEQDPGRSAFRTMRNWNAVAKSSRLLADGFDDRYKPHLPPFRRIKGESSVGRQAKWRRHRQKEESYLHTLGVRSISL